MFKKLAALFKKAEPVNPQITDAVTQMPIESPQATEIKTVPAPVAEAADVIKAAVTEQIAEAKPRNTRPRSPRKNTAKKKAP
jgi:hypothetical protein